MVTSRRSDVGEVVRAFLSVFPVVIPLNSSVVAVVMAFLSSVVNRVTSSNSLSVLLDGISGVTEVLSVTEDVTCSLTGDVVELVISSLLATEEDEDSIPSLTSGALLVTTSLVIDEEDTETPCGVQDSDPEGDEEESDSAGGVEDSDSGGGVEDPNSSPAPSVLVGWVDEETSVKTKSVPGSSSFVNSTGKSESEIIYGNGRYNRG